MNCLIEDCAKPIYTRGVCQKHYTAARRAGTDGDLPYRAMRLCEAPDCNEKHFTNGWCKLHYSRMRDSGRLELPPAVPLAERFWALVDRSGECWLWTNRPDAAGYGRLSVGNRTRYAHRVAWELTFGPIPEGLVLDHLRESGVCSSKLCVRPDHLELVTLAENSRRQMVARYRKDVA